MEWKPELLDELLKGMKTEEDLAGPNGLLKQITKALVERMLAAVGSVDRVTWQRLRETTYCVRYLQRVPLGTPYPAVVERVMKLVKNPRMMGPCEVVECYRRGRRGGGPAARGLARWTVGADDDYGRECAGAVGHGLECAEAGLGCRAASDV